MSVNVIDIEKDNVRFVQSALDEIEKSNLTAYHVLSEFYHIYAPKVYTRTPHEKLNHNLRDINTIHFTTDNGWKVENIEEVIVVTFPEGMFEKVGGVQHFTFTDDTSLEDQLVLENQVGELIRKLETFKAGV